MAKCVYFRLTVNVRLIRHVSFELTMAITDLVSCISHILIHKYNTMPFKYLANQ